MYRLSRNTPALRLALALVPLWVVAVAPLAAQSHWVALDSQGKLVYGHFKTGDRIPDFSYAGYHSGGVALPLVAAKRTVAPSGADDTAVIQRALDEVAKLPLVDGHRGAVELAPGAFHCSKTLTLAVSGVVLRGAGPRDGGTTIEMTGDPHLGIRVAGALKQSSTGSTTAISDAYVASGTTTFHVENASSIHPGDTVAIVKPITEAWIVSMGMDKLTRPGKSEHWISGDLSVLRRVAAVSGNAVTLEIALMDNYDARFFDRGHATVTPVAISGQVTEVGVEGLRVIAPRRATRLGEDPEFDGLQMRDAADCWLQDVAFEEATNSVAIDSGTDRITLRLVSTIQHVPVTSPAKPFDFSINGSQILLDRCSGAGDQVFYVATQQKQQGPVVVLHSKFLGNGHIEPHQRWSTGLLVDNCEVPGGGINLMNRGGMGTGHGWTIGWSVSWNNQADEFVIQQPPGTANWSIGDRGPQNNPNMPTYDGSKVTLRQSIIESPNHPVAPQSLYLEQLAERLGPQALKNIGY